MVYGKLSIRCFISNISRETTYIMMLLKTLLAIALAWGSFAGLVSSVQDSNPIPKCYPCGR